MMGTDGATRTGSRAGMMHHSDGPSHISRTLAAVHAARELCVSPAVMDAPGANRLLVGHHLSLQVRMISLSR